MRCEFTFGRTVSGDFLITVEIHSQSHPWLTVAAFPDENAFIESCVQLIDSKERLESILTHILRAGASLTTGTEWTSLDLSEAQLRGFHILNPLQVHDGLETFH